MQLETAEGNPRYSLIILIECELSVGRDIANSSVDCEMFPLLSLSGASNIVDMKFMPTEVQ